MVGKIKMSPQMGWEWEALNSFIYKICILICTFLGERRFMIFMKFTKYSVLPKSFITTEVKYVKVWQAHKWGSEQMRFQYVPQEERFMKHPLKPVMKGTDFRVPQPPQGRRPRKHRATRRHNAALRKPACPTVPNGHCSEFHEKKSV